MPESILDDSIGTDCQMQFRSCRQKAAAFERSFTSTNKKKKKIKLQCYIELINYHSSEITELESIRVWLTDVFTCRFFNHTLRVKLRGIF